MVLAKPRRCAERLAAALLASGLEAHQHVVPTELGPRRAKWIPRVRVAHACAIDRLADLGLGRGVPASEAADAHAEDALFGLTGADDFAPRGRRGFTSGGVGELVRSSRPPWQVFPERPAAM